MKQKTNPMKNKMRSRSGETLTEILVAVLISSLAIALLVTMISVSSGMIDRSRNDLSEYYMRSNDLAEMQDSGLSAGVTTETGTLSLKLNGAAVPLSTGKTSFNVKYYVNDLEGSKVVSYKLTD